MNTPITTEYAVKKLSEAIKTGNQEEMQRWELAIRGNNDFRVIVKQRMRLIKDSNLRSRLRREYK